MIAPGIQKFVSDRPTFFSSLRHWCGRVIMVLAALLLLGTSASATTYYVSPTGSDSNNGTSTTTPWQTITKVNGAHFVAGDSVLFQGSGTFTGALVFSYATNIPTSSASTPITVSSYGTGAAEILSNSTGTLSSAVKLDGVNGIHVTGLTILGGGGASPTTWIGVYILNQSGKSISGVTVNNCNISNFAGTVGANSAEVYVDGYFGALDTINITNNQLHGANGVGSTDSNGIYGIGSGENITNVTYSGNTVYNLGGLAANTGGGIVANGVNGGLLEYNVVHDVGGNSTSCGGPGGIWAYTSNNITIQFNEVYKVEPITYTAGCDWIAFDLDGGVSNSVVQYNYSHNNFGTALLAYSSDVGSDHWGNNIYRYNISENDAVGSGSNNGCAIAITHTPTNPIQIYGNTIYMGQRNSTGLSFALGSNNGVALVLPTGSVIENNIIDIVPQSYYGHTYSQYMYFPYGLTGGTIDHNIYYGGGTYNEWRVGGTTYTSLSSYVTATGYDTHSLNSSPGLDSPGTGGTISWTPSLHDGPQPDPSGYQLASGSPAINAGATVSGATRDYYGNTVPGSGGTNIGASQVLYGTVPVILDVSGGTGVTVTGTWSQSTSISGYYGSYYLWAAAGGANTVKFTPTLPSSGNYQVYAWWTANPNRATNAAFSIVSASGTSNLQENQQNNNGQWVSLGTFQFNSGTSGSVTISSAGANGDVIADAIEFVPQ